MAFDLDMADYPDNAAFWAASAPDYLTIFQPEETSLRLLPALFPDSAHVDQYGGKAFPYCESVVLLHAGIVDEPLKRAQMAQVIVQPERLGNLASTIVATGISMSPVKSQHEAISRIQESKRQTIEDGDRDAVRLWLLPGRQLGMR